MLPRIGTVIESRLDKGLGPVFVTVIRDGKWIVTHNKLQLCFRFCCCGGGGVRNGYRNCIDDEKHLHQSKFCFLKVL
jgi:hypothetical protein